MVFFILMEIPYANCEGSDKTLNSAVSGLCFQPIKDARFIWVYFI